MEPKCAADVELDEPTESAPNPQPPKKPTPPKLKTWGKTEKSIIMIFIGKENIKKETAVGNGQENCSDNLVLHWNTTHWIGERSTHSIF